MKNITLNDKIIDFSTPLVMGILNITTDSFYDGGKYNSETAIIKRIHQIVEEGASIIDIGAYSTRPGAKEVDDKEEFLRISAALELVRKYYPDIIVSIDTFRSLVASEINKCLGPVIVNDISGGTMDEKMFDFIAESHLPYIMMHIQGTPQTMQKNPTYNNVTLDIYQFLEERIKQLNERGFYNIILDPGFGFGKTLEHNYELLNHMEKFKELDYPLLVGVSRKSMIYKFFDFTPQEALNGTTVINTIALLKGANILRVHDVKEAVEAIKIVEKMKSEK